jgi:hypothetical protein
LTAVGEESLSRSHDDGEDPQAVLVDQVVTHQRLKQVRAAMHLQLGAVTSLSAARTVPA